MVAWPLLVSLLAAMGACGYLLYALESARKETAHVRGEMAALLTRKPHRATPIYPANQMNALPLGSTSAAPPGSAARPGKPSDRILSRTMSDVRRLAEEGALDAAERDTVTRGMAGNA